MLAISNTDELYAPIVGLSSGRGVGGGLAFSLAVGLVAGRFDPKLTHQISFHGSGARFRKVKVFGIVTVGKSDYFLARYEVELAVRFEGGRLSFQINRTQDDECQLGCCYFHKVEVV